MEEYENNLNDQLYEVTVELQQIEQKLKTIYNEMVQVKRVKDFFNDNKSYLQMLYNDLDDNQIMVVLLNNFKLNDNL